jgi:magnesium transporter
MDSQASSNPPVVQQPDGKKKRKHRGGKRKKNRRQSFAAPSVGTDVESTAGEMSNQPLSQVPENGRASFYGMGSNLSNESMSSEALLDHRWAAHLLHRTPD